MVVPDASAPIKDGQGFRSNRASMGLASPVNRPFLSRTEGRFFPDLEISRWQDLVRACYKRHRIDLLASRALMSPWGKVVEATTATIEIGLGAANSHDC